MKTNIKRHSRSVLSVILAICMLVSCMTVGLIATDAAGTSAQSTGAKAAADETGAVINNDTAKDEGAALDNDTNAGVDKAASSAVGAKADSDSVGAADVYCVKGTFNAWNESAKFNATTKKVSVNLAANTTYNFKIYSTYGDGKWYGASKNYTGTDSEYYFNSSNNSEATIKTTVAGDYVFELKREDNNDGAVAIGVTYPSAAKTYTISKAATSNGSFTVSKTSATAGTSITVNATPNRGYKIGTITATGATVSVSGNTGTFTMPSQNVTVTVTFTAATARTISASTDGNGTITLKVSSGSNTYAAVTTTGTAASTVTAYEGETVTATVSPASGYQKDTFKRGTNTITGNSDTQTVGNSNLTYTATFKKVTYNNQYTASLGTGTTNTYNKVKASFFDYYTDNEFNDGWITGIKQADRGEGVATCTPNNKLNTAIRDYTHTNNLPYPLYFGNFYDWNDYAINSYMNSEEEGWNFYNKVNNSQRLDDEHQSVTGLTGKTLSSNGIPNHYKSGANNENGAEMKLFDKNWLSTSAQNGQGELATIIDSQFPVKKTTVNYGTGSHDYYSFDSATDNLWFENIESGYDNTVAYLNMSNTSGACTWYAYLWNSSNTTTNTWVKATATGTTNQYSFTNPDPSTYNKVIFMRTNGTTGWGSNIYNKTADLDWPSGSDNKLLYTTSGYISGKGGKDEVSMNGSWGAYSGATKKTINPTVNYSTSNSDAVYSPNYGNRGFYPFDHKHAGTNSTNNRAWDLGFGVSMEIKFTLGPNGKTADGAEQVFTYSGDDDLWVFVDDKLILDLGGDHKKSSGTINFATKTVSVPESIKAPNSSATRNTAFTLEDKTVHTMKIFYMERGMFDSNLSFGFSMYPYEDTYEVEKKIDTNGLNAGLANQFSDTFTFKNTSGDSKGNGAAYEVFNTATNASVRKDTTITSREFSINGGQYAKFSNIFTVNQNLKTDETPSGYYQYDTSYQVIDMQNGDHVIKAGNVSLSDPDKLTTGNFNFFTTLEGADPELDITHLRTIFTNKLQTESFMVTKDIQGYDDSSTEFPFYVTIKMSPGGGKSDFNFNTQGLVYTSSLNGTHSLGTGGLGYIHEGEYITFEGIPKGAKVTVYEPVSGSDYTPDASGNANCYKNVTINSVSTKNQPQYHKRGTNNADVTFQLDEFDTITIENEPKKYQMDYKVPTRLYGDKIYTLSGFITPAMADQGYVDISDTEHTAFLTKKFVEDHTPTETIFMKDVSWNYNNIDFDSSRTGIDDFVNLTANAPVDKKLTVEIDTDGDRHTDLTINNLAFGAPIKQDGEYIPGEKDGKTPSYWEIYKTADGSFVTRCYSTLFNYVAYDNYTVYAVYGQGSNYELYDNDVSAAVSDLGITRSHWNTTVSGVDDINEYIDIDGTTKTYTYNKANKEYDRLYLDIALAYEAEGKMISTYSTSDIQVGYEVVILNEDGTYKSTYKDVAIDNSTLDNKNRIHAYYGFVNSAGNRKAKLGIRSYINTGTGKIYSYIMAFSLDPVGSKY